METDRTEKELLQRAMAGDYEAFASLSERHRQGACEFIARIAGAGDAEDVFMTALLKAWKSIGAFNGKSSYKTWLFSITRYAALDYLRKTKTRGEVSVDDEESGASLGGMADERAPEPYKQIENDERSRIIDKAMEELTEAHREVIDLYYYEDFKYSEIAEILGISIGTVMSRLHHAKANLSKSLSAYKDELI